MTNELEKLWGGAKATKRRRLGDRWRLFKANIGRKRYFIRTLKEVGILRFGDRIRIMFSRDVGRIQMEVIDRLAAVYEKAFFSIGVQKRSSVAGEGLPPDSLVETAQDMPEGNRSPN